MRVFVGIDMPQDVRRVLVDHVAALEPSLPPAKWVKQEAYHITLTFLGEVEEAAIPLIDKTLSGSIVDQERFTLRLKSAGCFPTSRGLVRVLWIGVDHDLPTVRLQTRVATALEDAELVQAEHRPYHPHVTVARCRKPWARKAGEIWTSSLEDVLGEPFEVSEIVLFRSQLASSGARYDRLRSYPFGACS